ncbi:Hpt domain-containing protein [Pseudoalteromonas phenolica]|uniref:Hpt domain-containing protein n=1 Tax=Pseudoalteromonas phenolica TaxID=161398 RepID=A0A5R9Q5G6_9GAMM|nr:Hpt domain-containing protein [Pseudoalteromonas phenolica]TLX48044.1 Hpt domain-containing protein [Pseudoalteromonas phenolica]
MSSPNNLQTLNNDTIIDLIGNEPIKIKKFQHEFLIQSASSLKEIVNYFNSNDFFNIKESAHFLKTSAKAIGAERSAYFLESIEEQCLVNNKPAIKQLLIKLNTELKAIKSELRNEEP